MRGMTEFALIRLETISVSEQKRFFLFKAPQKAVTVVSVARKSRSRFAQPSDPLSLFVSW
ncbi:MAG TPA: hypothetical protein VGR59_15600 [Gemmatimonadaceae bacterium]|nr:hypothetical protein [Gemmatimonadaceae bacterium]